MFKESLFTFGMVFSVAAGLADKAHAISYVKCPTFVVDTKSKTFQTFSKALPGQRCTTSKSSLIRKGFTQIDTPANPILDNERIFQGTGDATIKKAFRVSATARIVTLTASGCTGNFGYSNGVGTFQLDDSSGAHVNTQTIIENKSISATIFEPGIYSISADFSSSAQGICAFEIRVQ